MRYCDSHVQVRNIIQVEVDNWCEHWGYEATWDERQDLAAAIHNELRQANAFSHYIPETTEDEDEHYN